MLARLKAPLFSGAAVVATALGLYTRPQRLQCDEQQQIGVRADGVVLAFDGKAMRVLLVKRKQDPHIGRWSLPGVYVPLNEQTSMTLRRELEDQGLKDLNMIQLCASHSTPRDNYAEVVSLAYLVFTPQQLHRRPSYGFPSTVPIVLRDQDDVDWFELDDLPPLAFEHYDVLRTAWARCECSLDEQGGRLTVRDKVSKKTLASLKLQKQNSVVDSSLVIKVPRLMIENGSL